MGLRMVRELGPQALQQVVNREIDNLRADHPGLELVDVEKRVQHARHRGQRFLAASDELEFLPVLELPRQ